jgi:hypothetical protein
MRMHPTMKGASLTIAIGRWVKPHAKIETFSVRICLGFIALTFYTFDIEDFIKRLLDERKK